MAGAKRRFGIQRRTGGEQLADDFAAVFAGDLAARPSVPLDLPIDAIEASPFQARLRFDDLNELVDAIRMHGFTSRIRVRPHPTAPDRYQLVFGERRLRAARAAELTTVPAEVAEHSDDELREIGLTENLLRRDLSPLEEGRAFVAALDAGYSVRRLAERIGKRSKGYVENRVAIARAPEDVQAMVEQRPDTLRAARAIMTLEREGERRPLISALMSGSLTTDDVAAVVRERKDAVSSTPAADNTARTTREEAQRSERSPAAVHTGAQDDTGVDRLDAPSRSQRAELRSRRQLEGEIVQVLAIVGRWRAVGVRSDAERQALGQGIARILAELDGLLRDLDDGTGS